MTNNLDFIDFKHDMKVDERDPLVLWDQPELNVFEVKIKARGLLPGKQSKPHDVKNGYADVTILKSGMDVLIELDDLKTNIKTVFRYKVKSFPSPVDRQRSSWKVEKDYVVISLHKKDSVDWMCTVRSRGLDLESSSSSNSEEEEEARAAMPQNVLRLDDIAMGTKRLVVIQEPSKK